MPLEDNHVTLDTRPEPSLADDAFAAIRRGAAGVDAAIDPRGDGGAVGADLERTPGVARSWKCDRIVELRSRIARDLGVDPASGDFWAAMKALQPVVAEDLLGGRGRSAGNGLLHWGEIDRALGDLRHTRALIVDVRLDGGGFDALALAFAGRFADHERLVFTKTPVLRGRPLESTGYGDTPVCTLGRPTTRSAS